MSFGNRDIEVFLLRSFVKNQAKRCKQSIRKVRLFARSRIHCLLQEGLGSNTLLQLVGFTPPRHLNKTTTLAQSGKAPERVWLHHYTPAALKDKEVSYRWKFDQEQKFGGYHYEVCVSEQPQTTKRNHK